MTLLKRRTSATSTPEVTHDPLLDHHSRKQTARQYHSRMQTIQAPTLRHTREPILTQSSITTIGSSPYDQLSDPKHPSYLLCILLIPSPLPPPPLPPQDPPPNIPTPLPSHNNTQHPPPHPQNTTVSPQSVHHPSFHKGS